MKTVTPTECLPPRETNDFTMHWLSREVGDGSVRKGFEALWTHGMWQTKDINPLSPRKAAWATWQYVEPGAAAIRRATLEQARDVEPVGGDYIDAGGWYVGYAHGVRAKTDAIAALIEGDAAINAKPPAP